MIFCGFSEKRSSKAAIGRGEHRAPFHVLMGLKSKKTGLSSILISFYVVYLVYYPLISFCYVLQHMFKIFSSSIAQTQQPDRLFKL